MLTEILTLGFAPGGLVETLFPYGITHYAIGGILIGLGVVIIFLGTGISAGASTFLESTWSYVSDLPRFQEARFVLSRDWRVLFTGGIIIGAALYALLFQSGLVTLASQPVSTAGELREVGGVVIWVTDVHPGRLFAGGILIGIGTRLGKGCTSGHGVCGVGSLSQTSIVNVATFMVFAIGTALIIQSFGVVP